MTKRPSFECPICSGGLYNSVTTADNRNPPQVNCYVCACCGFTFLDPARYRRLYPPYSTLRQTHPDRREEGLR